MWVKRGKSTVEHAQWHTFVTQNQSYFGAFSSKQVRNAAHTQYHVASNIVRSDQRTTMKWPWRRNFSNEKQKEKPKSVVREKEAKEPGKEGRKTTTSEPNRNCGDPNEFGNEPKRIAGGKAMTGTSRRGRRRRKTTGQNTRGWRQLKKNGGLWRVVAKREQGQASLW